MRQLLILFITIFISCGQAKTKEELLTNNKWTIEKVENIKLGEVGPEELNKGTLWVFDKDNSFSFEMKNEFWDKKNTGTWTLSDDNLTLIEKGDTTLLRIDKLTNKDFICTSLKEETLKFTLVTSKDN